MKGDSDLATHWSKPSVVSYFSQGSSQSPHNGSTQVPSLTPINSVASLPPPFCSCSYIHPHWLPCCPFRDKHTSVHIGSCSAWNVRPQISTWSTSAPHPISAQLYRVLWEDSPDHLFSFPLLPACRSSLPCSAFQ